MKKRTIFIELTSLLDVILIMIFVLLTQAKAQTTEAIEDAAADREIHVLLDNGPEEADDAVVNGVGGLDLDNPDHDGHSQRKEQQGQEEHNHVDSVAVLDGVLYFALPGAHLFFITVAGSFGIAASEPSFLSLVSVADALLIFTSAASLSV